jgi:outer membrane protein TolC
MLPFLLYIRRHRFSCFALACAVGAANISGCASPGSLQKTIGNDTTSIDSVSWQVDNPQPEIVPEAWGDAPMTPRTLRNTDDITYRDMAFREVIAIAMQNSEVLRELGGTILRTPEIVASNYTTGLQETDPRFGMEAALSAFDAQLNASAFFNNTDRIFNNQFFSGGANTLVQDKHDYLVELSKPTATGSVFSLRSVTDYDSNNAPNNTFPSAWDTFMEAEVRQPLMQGGGLEFNRIAGPLSSPGAYNGILIAKVNTDITSTGFEMAVRNYVSNVANAYWDLYFAYRDLDARRKGTEKALETWRIRKARAENDEQARSQEALAREQYYRFKAELDESLAGQLTQGTQVGNGSTGGTLRGTGGVQVAERRLRLLIGMTINDGELLRPDNEPEYKQTLFDWESARSEALVRRPELRRQQLRIRQREMERLAAQNFLNPRLDFVGQYRWRGFGKDLIRDGNQGGATPVSALGNLADGDHQEWQLGIELSVPIGYRQAHAAVANAELALLRERAIYREQQRQVVHDLSNAIADVDRSWEACENNLNRLLAAKEVLDAFEAEEQADRPVEIDRILDAQRRVVESELRYFRSRAEYAVALKNTHLEKGSIMAYNDLQIFDGSVPLNTEVAGDTREFDMAQTVGWSEPSDVMAKHAPQPDSQTVPEPFIAPDVTVANAVRLPDSANEDVNLFEAISDQQFFETSPVEDEPLSLDDENSLTP